MPEAPVRRRAAFRPPAATPAASPAQPTGGRAGWLKRGGDILATAESEVKKAEERSELRKAGLGNVFRFWLEKGKEAEVIVLDNSLEDAVALYEHNLKDSSGKYGVHETCVKEFANCPVCDKFGDSSYVMFLTILDLRGYDRKLDGGKTEHIPQSRKLLPITMQQIPKWRQVAQNAIAEVGTLRGTYLVLQRGAGDKTPRIGEPAILAGGRIYDTTPEEDLEVQYGHDAIMGKDGKTVVKVANADITPFDYEKLFPEPDVNDLLKRYGGSAGAGSAREVVAEFGAEQAGETTGARTRSRATPAAAAAPTRARTRPTPAQAPAEPEEALAPAEGEEPFEGE